MKVVGGPHDGLDVWVNPALQNIKLANPVEINPTIDWLCSECGRVAPTEIKYTVYTVRRINDIEFLAPQDWSVIMALRHQFTK